MSSSALLAVDDARALVDHSVEVVEALLALATPRKGVSRALRNRIGRRDGWICRICNEPVDPALAYQQRTPQEARDHAEYLAQYAAEDVHTVIAWVGQDGGRARSAFQWFHETQPTSDLPEEAARSRLHAFYGALMPVAQARAEHNSKTASVEHLQPVSFGGGNEMDNLAIAHRGCNTTVNPMAGNADLLDARRLAVEFLDRLRRGSTNGRAQAGRLDRVCIALVGCGHQVPEREDLVARFPAALAVVHVAFADMWAARRECRIHVLGLWWEANRLRAAGDRERLRELMSTYRQVPWRGHTAQWWSARRAELPELLPASIEFMRTRGFEVDEQEDLPGQVPRAFGLHR